MYNPEQITQPVPKPVDKWIKEYNPFGQAEIDKYFISIKEEYSDLADDNIENIIKSKIGWEKLVNDFTENNYSEEFNSEDLPYEVNPRANEFDVDEYEDIKTLVAPLMFKYNTDKAREFFGDYLIKLYQIRRRAWSEREMWADHSEYEPNDYEEEKIKNKHEYFDRFVDKEDYLDDKSEFNIDDYVEIPEDMKSDNVYKEDDKQKNKDKNLRHDSNIEMEEEFEIYDKITTALIREFAEYGKREDIDKLIKYLNNNYYSRYHLSDLAECFEKIDTQYTVEKLLDNFTDRKKSEIFILLLTDLISVEIARQELNKRIENVQDREHKDDLQYARALITPNHDKIAIENLQKFYAEKIKFEDYGINQKMNEKEVKLLKSLIGEDEKVLEEGCGTGRLLLEMKQAGYDITGYDFTKRHVDLIKAKDSEAKVFQGDWHNNALENESFNTVYSLGRNILHDYSIVDQTQLFREAARILKPGGKFIFDIPNRAKGGYKQMVNEYGKEMKSRGIKNFREGAIYDSPDGKNFTTRYVYSEDDIKFLAQIAGFKIRETRREALATGKGDENLYFVLEKV